MKASWTTDEQAQTIDATVKAMLDAFAGPVDPLPSRQPAQRRASRRTLLVVAIGIVLLGLSVPAALGLLGQLSETPPHFLRDTSQPLNARKQIELFMRHAGSRLTLTRLRRVVTAETPEGKYVVYELFFSHQPPGMAIISAAPRGDGAFWGGSPTACPDGWALRATGSFDTRPGRTPIYLAGETSPAVAAVDVVYPDGHSTPAAVSNGYFLAWVTPRPHRRLGPTVTIVAHNAAGKEIGHLDERRNGSIPRRPGQPTTAPSCG